MVMDNRYHFDIDLIHASIDREIGQANDRQFACFGNAPDPPQKRKLLQHSYGLKDTCDHTLGRVIVFQRYIGIDSV